MEYVKIKIIDNVDIMDQYFEEMPIWFKRSNAPENQLTSDELLAMQIYPTDDNFPAYNEFNEIIEVKDFSEWIFDSTSQIVLKQYDIITLTFEEKKIEMFESLATIRFENEISGVDSPGGIIATDRSSQSMLNSSVQVLRDDPTKTINWKCEDGWVVLDLTAIEQISQLVINHVENCFDNEFSIWSEIDSASDMTDLELINMDIGWP